MHRRVQFTELIDEDQSASGSVDGTTEFYHFNWARIFSAVNRRHCPMVDEKGNALNYIVAIKQTSPVHIGNSQMTTTIETANQGYVTKAAIKAWDRARKKMLRREGISLKSLGPYSRNLRFQLEDGTEYTPTMEGGEWTNTKFAVEAPLDSANTSAELDAEDLIDDYSLTLCDASVVESAEEGETKYTTVGIIDSWVAARRSRSDFVSTDTAIDHDNNPLYNILSGSMASEEVLEIVEDAQKEEAPYSTSAATWRGLFHGGRLDSAVNVVDSTIVTCPAGLMKATFVSSDSDGNTSTNSTVAWDVELLDVVPM